MRRKRILFIFDGAWAYRPKRFSLYEKLRKEPLYQVSKEALQLIRKETKTKSTSPILDIIYKKGLSNDIEVFYYSEITTFFAKKKIKELSKNAELEINIAGYSWGGDAAMRLAKDLKKKNISVHKMLTIDPIRKAWYIIGFLHSLRWNSHSSFFKKLPNVKIHINHYQKTDRFALPFTHLRGNQVIGADLNFNLSEKYPEANHCNIENFKEVLIHHF